jgi:hypothetical protein
MTDFLSKISGQISGAMIIGSFFPSLLFLVVLSLVVLPLTPAHIATSLSAVVSSGKSWDEKGIATLIASLIALVLAILVNSMNGSILRFYEGYSWRDSGIDIFLRRRNQRKFDEIMRVRKRAGKLRKQIRLCNLQPSLARKTIVAQRGVARVLNDFLPNDRELVAPTELGNVFAALEMYTERLYGAPMVNLWPRLRSVLESDRAQAIDAVKANFDFMLNSSFLSGVLALGLTTVGLVWHNPIERGIRQWQWQSWIAWDLALIAISFLAYLAAVGRAAEWGTQVKACFDLYRRSLLDKLGYANYKPVDLTEERRIWQLINYKLSFPDEPSPDIPYNTPPASLIVEPVSATVALTQTVVTADDKTMTVTAEIANNGPLALPADRVILREEMPTGLSYVAGSATVNGTAATLLSVNPLQIDVGPLAYYESRTVVYKLKAQA